VPVQRVTVALPGTVEAPQARGEVGRLLCVGAVAPHKGHDILLEALGRLGSVDWTCTVAGSLEADPAFAARMVATAAPFGSRVRLTGVLDDAELDAEYRRSGVLVAPSRTESFGMAIAEARARGLPVIAASVGGISESVAGGGAILVSPDDPAALADALERWMTDSALRTRLRAEAADARARSPRWSTTVDRIDQVLTDRVRRAA
jgi:glycosyltransferase involved in cell wall biosynthesis